MPSSCELKRGASAHIILNQIESIGHMNMGLQFHLREDRGRDCLFADPLLQQYTHVNTKHGMAMT